VISPQRDRLSKESLVKHAPLSLALVLSAVSGCTLIYGEARVPGGEICGESICNLPPANVCIDGTKLSAHAPAGRCQDLLCTYAAYTVVCANGCTAGACIGDEPCDGVACAAPPSNYCVNASTLRSHDPSGTCEAGACSYFAHDVACQMGCSAGTCIGEPCAAVSCANPPAASCVGSTMRRTYAAAGTCTDGTCSYAPTDTPCPVPANGQATCTSGVCDFTCNAPFMKNGSSCGAQGGGWVGIASMPTARYGLAAAPGADGRIYAIGGRHDSDNKLATVEAYTPTTNSWVAVAPMSTARSWPAAAAGADGRIYVFGGWNQVALASAEVYTPGSNSWAPIAAMPTARSDLAAARGEDGRIYVIGGSSASDLLSTVEAYDPVSNTWTAVAGLTYEMSPLAAAAGVDGKIYVIGITQNGIFSFGEAYDPVANTWSHVDSIMTNRFAMAAASVGGRIYAIGGASLVQQSSGVVEVYDPSTLTFSAVANLVVPRRDLAAATGTDGRIYAIGGDFFGASSVVEALTP